MNTVFDTVILNADIATASDRYRADIGIRQGRIAAIAQGLGPGTVQTLDAAGRDALVDVLPRPLLDDA